MIGVSMLLSFLGLLILIILGFIIIVKKFNIRNETIKEFSNINNKIVLNKIIEAEQEIEKSKKEKEKRYNNISDYLKIIILIFFFFNIYGCYKHVYIKPLIDKEIKYKIENQIALIKEIEKEIKKDDKINWVNDKACINETAFKNMIYLINVYKILNSELLEIIKLNCQY